MSTTASALCLIPTHSVEAQTVIGAAALVCAGAFHGKPKTDLSVGRTDILLIVGLGLVGARALSLASSTSPEEPWRFVGAFAALTVLASQRTRELCAAMWAQLRPDVPPPPALDLSRYALSVERAAPAVSTPLPEGVEAMLVDTGTFRVDAEKMVDKLRRFQLADPAEFAAAWVRCAVASRAKRIRFHVGLRTLSIDFDGRPFSPAELAHPYDVLIEGSGKDARRGRHFAYGLLALFRQNPKGLVVTSRGEGGTALLRAGAAPEADLEAAPEGTVIRIAWPVSGFWRGAQAAFRAVKRYGMTDASLWVNGARFPPADPEQRMIRGRVEGASFTAVSGPEADGRLKAYLLGTFIEELSTEESGGLSGHIGFEDVELDISQASLVRGPALRRAVERVVRYVEKP